MTVGDCPVSALWLRHARNHSPPIFTNGMSVNGIAQPPDIACLVETDRMAIG